MTVKHFLSIRSSKFRPKSTETWIKMCKYLCIIWHQVSCHVFRDWSVSKMSRQKYICHSIIQPKIIIHSCVVLKLYDFLYSVELKMIVKYIFCQWIERRSQIIIFFQNISVRKLYRFSKFHFWVNYCY